MILLVCPPLTVSACQGFPIPPQCPEMDSSDSSTAVLAVPKFRALLPPVSALAATFQLLGGPQRGIEDTFLPSLFQELNAWSKRINPCFLFGTVLSPTPHCIQHLNYQLRPSPILQQTISNPLDA